MDQSKLVSNKEATSHQMPEDSETTKYQKYSVADTQDGFPLWNMTKFRQFVYGDSNPDVCDQFEFIRRVKGDGNCFYRALCFALIEPMLNNKSSMQRFRDKLIRSQEVLITAGFDESTFKDCLSTFLSVMEQLEADGCEETLLKQFNDQATSDSMVKYLRLLTSAHLQNHADVFQHFVEAPNLKVYCTQEVEAMAMECDHVEILALSEELDVNLCIISMEGSQLSYHTIAEGSQPTLYLLYQTSHYDILYKHREQE